MSDLFLWLIVIEKTKVVFSHLGWWIFGTFGLTFLILFLCKLLESVWEYESSYEDYCNIYKKIKPVFLFIIITCFIMGTIGVFLPSKSEVITYYTLKQVDKYNQDNKTSIFSPDNIIGGADKKLQKISDIIDKSFNRISDLIDKKIPEQEKK